MWRAAIVKSSGSLCMRSSRSQVLRSSFGCCPGTCQMSTSTLQVVSRENRELVPPPPEQQQQQEQQNHGKEQVLRSLLDTLLTSQLLVRPPLATSLPLVAPQANDHNGNQNDNGEDDNKTSRHWLQFFETFGGDNIMLELEDVSWTTNHREQYDDNDADTTGNVSLAALNSSIEEDDDNNNSNLNAPYGSSIPKDLPKELIRNFVAAEGKITQALRYYDNLAATEKKAHRKTGKRLDNNIKNNNHHDTNRADRVMHEFTKAQYLGVADYLDEKLVYAILFHVSERDPFDTWNLFCHFRRILGTNKDIHAHRPEAFKKVCRALSLLNPDRYCRTDIQWLIRTVVAEAQRVRSDKQKQHVYPILISSLVSQRSCHAGQFPKYLLHHMLKNNFSVSDGYWEHLLATSKFHRQDDLPYASILQQAVSVNRFPAQHVVMQILENLFPYWERIDDTLIALKAIRELVTKTKDTNDINYDPRRSYPPIDNQVLESIATAAATTRRIDVILELWQLMEITGVTKVTAAMYEHTIVTLVSDSSTIHNAFAILKEMEQKCDTPPSRALIRSISTKLRISHELFQVARDSVTVIGDSVSGWNAILSACAQKGRMEDALEMLAEVKQPNADSYSFAFESMGKFIRNGGAKDGDIESYLQTAETLLNEMETKGIEPSRHVIRDYVEFLCLVEEHEVARQVVKEMRHVVNGKTVYRVAVSCVISDKVDLAKEIVSDFESVFPFTMAMLKEDQNHFFRSQVWETEGVGYDRIANVTEDTD